MDVKPKFPRPPMTTTHTTSPFSNSSRSTTSQNSTPPSLLSHPMLPIKKLTTQQMQERWALGLCYNCDEKFVPEHKCSPPKFFFQLYNDETESAEPTVDNSDSAVTANSEMGSHFHLSTFSLTGQPSTQTLEFQRSIFGQIVSVLVDTGSSHNIIQPRMVQFLNLSLVYWPTWLSWYHRFLPAICTPLYSNRRSSHRVIKRFQIHMDSYGSTGLYRVKTIHYYCPYSSVA
uniref:Uncharacterized protein n=1 Tax=Cajanus cajan TaxID=3821 RepID=A0A151QNC3_CAJCA|nr:hypothetical protein KK1_047758 [Cajanus cajan]